MPRKPRRVVVVPNQPHHVIVRGNNRRRLFSYPREYRYFVRLLVSGSHEHGVPVHACAVMANHAHLVVTPTSYEQLGDFVSHFSQRYAQFRNRSRGASGKLFEQRYKSVVIESEPQLAMTIAYVDLNPVRAGVCPRPDGCRWSTYAQHAGLVPRESVMTDLWGPSPWYWSLGSDEATRTAAYRHWVKQCLARDRWIDVEPDPVVGGDRKRFERPDRSGAQ